MFYETKNWALMGLTEFELGDNPVEGCHFEERIKVWAGYEPALWEETEDGYKVFGFNGVPARMTVCVGTLSIHPMETGCKFADGLYSVGENSLWVSDDPEASQAIWRIARVGEKIRVRELQRADKILLKLI